MEKKSILVLGLGRSSTALIAYLLDKAEEEGWHIILGDRSQSLAEEKIGNSKCGEFVFFDLRDTENSRSVIQRANVVVSLLPSDLHPRVARLCLAYGKHLFTASYISGAMQALHKEAQSKGLLFLNECGLDPGIDHMSAMQMIDQIRNQGSKIVSFKSFAGGLIAPETDTENPWRYKFTWNPRSVVKAGQGTAKFLHEGKYKYISYCKLFKQITPVHIPGYGDFVGYANRDSLKYIALYALEGIQTMLRGTLRNKGFCTAWNVFVQLGCTDDTYPLAQLDTMTHSDFIDSFLPFGKTGAVEEKVADFLGIEATAPELERVKWLECFSNEKIGLKQGTPARALEHILNKRWALSPHDKDMVVMWHHCVYEHEGKKREKEGRIIYLGEHKGHTAMAKGVGLPLAIAVKLFLQGKISQRGVHIPIKKNIYGPILDELQSFGIQMEEIVKPAS